MNDAEFDLMDELYFVQSYSYLKETLDWKQSELIDTLKTLYEQGYIKCLDDPDTERFGSIDFQNEATELYFLANKKGLMAHNSI